MQQQQPVKKKILFLITKSNWGGAQRYVFDLATNLPSSHFDVVVALGGDGVLKEKLETQNIRVISLQEMKNETSFLRIRSATNELVTTFMSERSDILHINSSLAGISGVIAARRAKIPKTLFTAHAWAFNENRSLFQRLIIKTIHWLTVLLADKTIAVSNAVKTQMNWPFVQNKMVVIHNGRASVDYLDKTAARSHLTSLEPRLADMHTKILSGTIAELHPIKQHEIMIEAVADLVTEGHSIRHLIIGDGEQKQKLQNLIVEKHLTKHVFLLGHIDEAARYLKAFDLFTLTSRSEALAYVVIEAAQAGLPIIATEVGGIPEIITHEANGLLVPSGDKKSLKLAILRLISDHKLASQLAKDAHATGQEFTLDRMITKTTELYTNSSRT